MHYHKTRGTMTALTTSVISKNRCKALLWLATFSCFMMRPLPAADLNDAWGLFYQGKYSQCVDVCREQVEAGIWNDGWSRLLIQSHLVLGNYEQAQTVYESVQLKFNGSLSLRLLGVEAYRYNGNSAQARRLLDEIPEMIRQAAYRFTDRENRLALGRYAITLGADARDVLKNYYDVVLRSDPRFVDAHVAVAELALQKSDYREAAKSLAKAVELRPQDPHIHWLLARAWESSDTAKTAASLARALELNPQHVDSLLMQARNRIDAERYAEAEQILQSVLAINDKQPIALALLAAVSHLTGQYEQEGQRRKQALATWDLNPFVDYTIGDVLSRHYRFAEAVEYQRRSMQMDPAFSPARFRLAQDLLRLGKDDEGWELVKQVVNQDRYNVEAFNLRTLLDRLEKFTTIEGDGIWLRMDKAEAAIYGQRAMRVLQQAKQVLEQKYDAALKQPVTVEIFPQQSDFAIRTFGLPGGAGFLGVCFGNVITANSPASQGESPSNWESVLWHEFCHSITLQKTNNRMPRWLSEGISVYEELERDSTWGQRINPLYQQMLLGEDFVPLSKLSSAFLSPRSGLHLQFAYYQSSLAVRYLIEVHGLETLQRLLIDLGMGLPMETALENRYGTMQALDTDYHNYVTRLATDFHPNTDFTQPTQAESAQVDWMAWVLQHPNSYFGFRQLTLQQIASGDWSAADASVQRLAELFPDDGQPGGAWDLAARVARGRKDLVAERAALERMTSLTSDRLDALLRLLEIGRQAEDWPAVARYADRMISINPLLTSGHQALADALRQQNKLEQCLEPLLALQQLKPIDPAGLHFQLAQAFQAAGEPAQARLQVLQALEISPRFREAQKLLISLQPQTTEPSANR